MARLFLSIYDLFHSRKKLLWGTFIITLIAICTLASRIHINEDISQIFPDDKRVEKFNSVFQNQKITDKVVVMVSLKDSMSAAQPDSLISLADSLVPKIQENWGEYISKISARVESDKIFQVFASVKEYLPVFLDERDYLFIDSLSDISTIPGVLQENYNQLISPVGMFSKKVISKDPLGFSFIVLKKLQQLQFDENYVLYDDYIFTRDKKCLLLFLQTKYPASNTGINTPFINGFRKQLSDISSQHAVASVKCFGAAVVSVDNSEQLRKDSMLTLGLMVVLLVVFLFGYFRKKRVPFLILMPVAFGGLFALACIYLLKSEISIMSISCGSIILGIAVNYSLHFLSHLKHALSVRECIKDLSVPMTFGSATTVLAFFSLQFVNASLLRDIGLFAGLSLVGAALCALIFLPHFLSPRLFVNTQERITWIDKLSSKSIESNKYVLIVIVLATPVLFYFAPFVSFSKDMNKLNHMTPETRWAQTQLEKINMSSLSAIYITSEGNNLQEALRNNERIAPTLAALKGDGTVSRFSNISSFFISDSLQNARIEKWNNYWTEEKRRDAGKAVHQAGNLLKFSPVVLNNFDSLISKKYSLVDNVTMQLLRESFFDQYIIESDDKTVIMSMVNVRTELRPQAYKALEANSVMAFDRQMITNLFMDMVHEDFNFIVAVSALLVFVFLLLVYGRIELTMITFIPMFITWVWILGIMALLDIEFNIVNVMVSTFIFGLGDDYSIFTMDSLLQEYRYRKKMLHSVRVSIALSVLTTISGLGVLIFAQHPAMRSIAAISIIGILCVFVMSQTLTPFIFRRLVTNRIERGLPPMTFLGLLRLLMTYSIFIFGAFSLTAVGLLFKIIPFAKKQTDYIYHALICGFTRSLIYSDPFVKKRIIGKTKDTFRKPSVIISNHSSFLDILILAMLHPKLILLTNKWVWNSPVFGGVVRLAQYYPVIDGVEESLTRLKGLVDEGYSIAVFPEGTRSSDGKIHRFHKGAFLLSEHFNIPILPILIHGAGKVIPKSSFYLNPLPLSIKILRHIENNDIHFGIGYSQRTKTISALFRAEYSSFEEQCETGKYFGGFLLSNYIYKGPVLEWYMRIKLRLENHYEMYHQLIPSEGSVLDLGCGYGFLSYMLHYRSDKRSIVGVDFDEQKIETARNCFDRPDNLQFVHSDATKFPLKKYDAIIMSDLLHYLTEEQQEQLLVNCFNALNPGGKLIVRDGDADLSRRHKGTRLTELFSIRLLGFNKSANSLHFVHSSRLEKIAHHHSMNIKKIDSTKLTSNLVFIFTAK